MEIFWKLLSPVLTAIGFIATGIGLWYNFLMSHKISTNELKHLAIDIKDIKDEVKEVKNIQMKCDERLSKVEGFVDGFIKGKFSSNA